MNLKELHEAFSVLKQLEVNEIKVSKYGLEIIHKAVDESGLIMKKTEGSKATDGMIFGIYVYT